MYAKTSAVAGGDHPDLSYLNGKSILVTGGTGTFGRAFVGRLLDHCEVQRLVVFSRDEFKQHEMAQQFNGPSLRYFIGDVRDEARLEMAMRGIDYVVHAAALKHVPIAEYNPFECVHTNVIGAENVIRSALKTGVKKVIGLSTDKAANPINLYGASKLCSDRILIAANNLAGAIGTSFAVVRYGNVLGSRGSVIPYFRNLIASGINHLPITHEAMTRFWITIDEAVLFVLCCLETMQGGELFVPKIRSMRVIDLARAMAPTIPFKIIGIRPGEKIHEILITMDDAPRTLDVGPYYVVFPDQALLEEYSIVGSAVSPGFSYTSENNPHWLTYEQMVTLLGTVR